MPYSDTVPAGAVITIHGDYVQSGDLNFEVKYSGGMVVGHIIVDGQATFSGNLFLNLPSLFPPGEYSATLISFRESSGDFKEVSIRITDPSPKRASCTPSVKPSRDSSSYSVHIIVPDCGALAAAQVASSTKPPVSAGGIAGIVIAVVAVFVVAGAVVVVLLVRKREGAEEGTGESEFHDRIGGGQGIQLVAVECYFGESYWIGILWRSLQRRLARQHRRLQEGDGGKWEALQEEVDVLTAVVHPNIVQVIV